MNDLPNNAVALARLVNAGQLRPRELADRALEQAQQYQERFRPFIRLTPEIARGQADLVESRLKQGRKLPLAGVPYAVKDLFDVRGTATTYGSKVFADRMAQSDATVVARLNAAGAVCVGKLNLHECAFGFTGENAHFGDCRNPWNPERIPGGSSSGSAVAVALGICPFTIGSDTGGSIRMPSALCGVTGLKPTYGRVSRAGGLPLSWTMDHVGPLARTAAEVAAVMNVIAGHDAADESSSRRGVPDYQADLAARVRGARLGIMHEWFFESLDPEVAAAMTKAIDVLVELGAVKREVHLPRLLEVMGAHRAIIFPEASAFHRPYLAQRPHDYSDGIRAQLHGGLFLTAVEYLRAQQARRAIRGEWAKVFAEIDLLVTPTTPVAATPFGVTTAELPGGAKPLVRAYLDLTLPFNFTGYPAISVPCGLTQAGLPLGMQLVARPFEEAFLLRCAHQYQLVTDWHKRAPKA
jgi:aspartyl-tRNA(Asn)/glutamyl-tRNA(Gln) amidotransferase subunit A